MRVAIVGDLTAPSDTDRLMSLLARERVDVVWIDATSTETVAAPPSIITVEELIMTAPQYEELEKPYRKPDNGNFRRQFGCTGKRLDRRYK